MDVTKNITSQNRNDRIERGGPCMKSHNLKAFPIWDTLLSAQSEIQLNILATGSIQSPSLKGAANIGTCVAIADKDIFPINMHQFDQISPL